MSLMFKCFKLLSMIRLGYMECIKEVFDTKVCGDYDVIVAGGGVAGAAAALAAVRNGAKTLLIEKMTVLGGLATAGHVVIYLPLCDGRGHKVVSGISEELLKASIKLSYDSLPNEWRDGPLSADTKRRYQTVFNAPAFALEIERLLLSEGVDILYDSVAVSCISEDGFCRAVVVENKSGRSAYRCRAAVDATGDGDLFRLCGVLGETGQNYLTFWAYQMGEKNSGEPKPAIPRLLTIGDCNGGGLPEGSRTYTGIDGSQVSEFLTACHRLAYDRIAEDKGGTVLCSFPSMPQYRKTWRLCGEYTLSPADAGKNFETSIACAPDWRRPGPVYEIPFETLYSGSVKNLLAAGRNISSTGDTWEVTRVIPVAAATGQAAGTAAAMLLSGGDSKRAELSSLSIKDLQENLMHAGAIVHIPSGAGGQ